MGKALVGHINVSKIDKSKLFEGKKGTYLDVIIWVNDEVDQFGNIASVQQTLTKEERDAGAKKIYLGNLKDLNSLMGKTESTSEKEDKSDDKDDLPF